MRESLETILELTVVCITAIFLTASIVGIAWAFFAGLIWVFFQGLALVL